MQWLPTLAFLLSAVAFIAGLTALRGHEPGRRWLRWGTTAAAITAAITFVVLVILFILVKVQYEYVFLYTSTAVPLRYRIAGAWAGKEGSLLLWAMYATIVAAVVMWRHHRAEQTTGSSRLWTEVVLAGVATAYLGAVAWQDMFSATNEFLLTNRPGGNGLNPTLLSPFILIHPPVMFMAYALTAVPLAAAVAAQITGEQAWSRIGMLWSRIDWLLYTFAMGLGGIWAYYTLGFGGYWAWDPVEVANLMPWLALTVFLHAQLHHRRYGSYAHVGPFLAVLPFLLTVFSTLSTRSGFWVSVHAFTDPTDTFDPDPGSRFLEILARESSLQFHTGMFLVALLGFLALWARRVALDTKRFVGLSRVTAGILGAATVMAALSPRTFLSMVLEASSLVGIGLGFGLLAVTAIAILLPALPLLVGEEERRWRLDLKTFGLASIAILGAGLLVIFLWHITAVNGWSTQTYLRRFPVLVTPVMLGLLVFQARAVWGKRALPLTGGVLLAALIGLWQAGAPGYLVVLGLGLLIISLQRVLRAGALSSLPRDVAIARAALWLAALGNVVFWLNPPTIRLGFVWQPLWPTQLLFGALAFAGLHLATELLCGRIRQVKAAHVVVGLLAGFYVAALIAIASWWVHRKAEPFGVSSPAPRLHQVGLYGVHLAVALVLCGYIATAYLGAEDDLTIATGSDFTIGGTDGTFVATPQAVDDGIATYRPFLDVGGTPAEPVLYWEPQSGSYYPLPGTARLWDRDVYFAIDAICIDPTGTCDAAVHWIRAYEPGSPLPPGIAVTQIQVQAFELPGIGLVWTALFGWLYFMAIVMLNGPERS